MKKFKRYIINHWLLIVVGLVATRYAVEYAYLERGYKAFGGEWFILPLMLLVVKLGREIIISVIKVFGMEDVDEPETARNSREL